MTPARTCPRAKRHARRSRGAVNRDRHVPVPVLHLRCTAAAGYPRGRPQPCRRRGAPATERRRSRRGPATVLWRRPPPRSSRRGCDVAHPGGEQAGWQPQPPRPVVDPAGFVRQIDAAGRQQETSEEHVLTRFRAVVRWRGLAVQERIEGEQRARCQRQARHRVLELVAVVCADLFEQQRTRDAENPGAVHLHTRRDHPGASRRARAARRQGQRGPDLDRSGADHRRVHPGGRGLHPRAHRPHHPRGAVAAGADRALRRRVRPTLHPDRGAARAGHRHPRVGPASPTSRSSARCRRRRCWRARRPSSRPRRTRWPARSPRPTPGRCSASPTSCRDAGGVDRLRGALNEQVSGRPAAT